MTTTANSRFDVMTTRSFSSKTETSDSNIVDPAPQRRFKKRIFREIHAQTDQLLQQKNEATEDQIVLEFSSSEKNHADLSQQESRHEPKQLVDTGIEIKIPLSRGIEAGNSRRGIADYPDCRPEKVNRPQRSNRMTQKIPCDLSRFRFCGLFPQKIAGTDKKERNRQPTDNLNKQGIAQSGERTQGHRVNADDQKCSNPPGQVE